MPDFPANAHRTAVSFMTTETDQLRRELRERLLALNFHAFAICMARVIEKMGGEDVRLAGRRNWRGRSPHGGYDLEATFPGALGKRRAIVQVKQHDTVALYQRSIDELRGVCLRVGANEALLITTATFAPSIDQALLRLQESLVAPVRLIDGNALLDLMIQYDIGVKRGTRRNARAVDSSAEQQTNSAVDGVIDDTDDTPDAVDTALFDNLARTHAGNGRANCGGPRFLVRVQVEPVRGQNRGPRSSLASHRPTASTRTLELQGRCG